MKKVLCAVLAVLVWSAGAWGAVTINAENFPDETFRSYVSSNCDTDGDGILSDEEISAVTSISISHRSISSLKGIEYFTALTKLYCGSNQLTELDVSNNTALTELVCTSNQLTELDISNNTSLTYLSCGFNQLTELDVSNNTALTSLVCDFNQLTKIGLSNSIALTDLTCYSNQLTELDVSNNTALTELNCWNNQLTKLDVSNNTFLTYLECSVNQLTELDVSNNTALTSLSCAINQLTELDVGNNTALTTLICEGNKITELDVSKNTALTVLRGTVNQLTELDLSNNTDLTTASYDQQTFTIFSDSFDTTSDASYPYSLTLTDINSSIDIDRVSSLNVTNSDDTSATFSQSGSTLYLAAIPSTITYNYDTKLSVDNAAYMDVTITITLGITGITVAQSEKSVTLASTGGTFAASVQASGIPSGDISWGVDAPAALGASVTSSGTTATVSGTAPANTSTHAVSYDITVSASDDNGTVYTDTFTVTVAETPEPLTFSFSPSDQTVARGGTITPIAISADNLSGDLVWSFAVSGDYDLGLTSSDSTITGTIPATTSADTYTIIITTHDSSNDSVVVSSIASITVTAAEDSVAGITGITINTPADKTASFTSIGGTLSATATASGTASGDITWTVSSSVGVSVDTSSNGSNATFTITISPNSANTTRTDTVTITAQDNAASFSDTITITTEAAPQPISISDRYRFRMTESLLRGILAAFAGMTEDDIYQLTDSEIISDTWSLTETDAQELAGLGERVVANIPAIRPQNTGVYVMKVDLSGELAGTKINLHGVSDVSASDLQDTQYTFFNEDGNVIDTIPEDKAVYVAMSVTAGTEEQGVITAPSDLASGTIVPISSESQDSLREVVAKTLNIGVGEVNFISEANILPAPDPTQAMIDKAASDDYYILGKLGLISVDKEGWYVFQVVLSDDLFRQLQDTDVNYINVYDFPVDVYDSEAKSAIINGLLGTWELMTMSGQKLEKVTAPVFLMGGFLNAGQPLTLYLAKLILAFLGLPVGCNAGLGLAGASVLLFVLMRRKSH